MWRRGVRWVGGEGEDRGGGWGGAEGRGRGGGAGVWVRGRDERVDGVGDRGVGQQSA